MTTIGILQATAPSVSIILIEHCRAAAFPGTSAELTVASQPSFEVSSP